MCLDWFHDRCLQTAMAASRESMFTCGGCMTKYDFLRHYAAWVNHLLVNWWFTVSVAYRTRSRNKQSRTRSLNNQHVSFIASWLPFNSFYLSSSTSQANSG